MGQIKTIKGKVAHKHETEADWELSSYVPEAGEIVVYDKDNNYNYPRIKVGDGVTQVWALGFVNPDTIGEIDLYGIDLKLNAADGKTLFLESDGLGWVEYPSQGYLKLQSGQNTVTVGAEGAGGEPGTGIVFKTGPYSRSLELGSTGDIHAYAPIIMGGTEQVDSKRIWMDGMGLHSEADNTKTIGDAEAPFESVYSNEFYASENGAFHGDLDGNAKTATDATNDRHGRVIDETYATKPIDENGTEITGWVGVDSTDPANPRLVTSNHLKYDHNFQKLTTSTFEAYGDGFIGDHIESARLTIGKSGTALGAEAFVFDLERGSIQPGYSDIEQLGSEDKRWDIIHGHTGRFVKIHGYDHDNLDILSNGAITLTQGADVCLRVTSGAELELPKGASIGGNVELTGSKSLTVGGNVLAKNYLQGKWIQSTQMSNLPSAEKICVFDKDGWLYYRDIDDLGVRDTKTTPDHSFYLRGYNSGFEDGGINTVDGANNAVFGDHNDLTLYGSYEPMSCIVGGSDNRVTTSFSIIGGVGNIVNASAYNSIIGGRWNVVGDNSSINSMNNLIGGERNTVYGTDNIVGGISNSLSELCEHNIVSGSSNVFKYGVKSNIVTGFNNIIDANTVLVVGNENEVAGANSFTYAAALGWGNKVTAQFGYAIGCGLTTTIDGQFIVGKYNDTTMPGAVRFAVGDGEDEQNRKNILTVTSTSTTVDGNLYSKSHTVNGDSTVRGNQTVTGNAAVRGSLDAGSINMYLIQGDEADFDDEVYQTSIAPASIQTYYRDSVHDIATITMDKGTIKLVSGPESAEEWQSKLYLAPDHISINGETFTAADIRKMKAFLATIAD